MVNILGKTCTSTLGRGITYLSTFVIALQYGVLVRFLFYTDRYLTLHALRTSAIRNNFSEEMHTTTPKDFSAGVLLQYSRLDRHDFQGA